MDKVYTKGLNVHGNLLSSFAFRGEKELLEFIHGGALQELIKKYGNLTYNTYDLHPFKVGDKCWVAGEGHDEFIIEQFIIYSDDRPGVSLDSGCTEEVVKLREIIYG